MDVEALASGMASADTVLQAPGRYCLARAVSSFVVRAEYHEQY